MPISVQNVILIRIQHKSAAGKVEWMDDVSIYP
jgi:hypothetical protein